MSDPETREGFEEHLAEAMAAETAIVAPLRAEHVRFIRFLVTGGIAAGINVGARWLLGYVLRYEIAIAVAYLIGMTTAFVLARLFVFEAEKAGLRGQYVRFALINAIAFVQVWLVSVGLARLLFPAIGWTWQAETLAHAIGVISPVATSYVGHKTFSFRREA